MVWGGHSPSLGAAAAIHRRPGLDQVVVGGSLVSMQSPLLLLFTSCLCEAQPWQRAWRDHPKAPPSSASFLSHYNPMCQMGTVGLGPLDLRKKETDKDLSSPKAQSSPSTPVTWTKASPEFKD